MRTRSTVAAALAALLLASAASAQGAPRFRGNLDLLAASPDDEFGLGIDGALGVGVGARLRLDPGDHLALRLDANWLVYGWDRRDVELRSPLGEPSSTELTTIHTLAFLQAGPELSATVAGVRPYVAATAGVAQFLTSASAAEKDDEVRFSTEAHMEDYALAYGGRAGVRVPFHVLRHRLDVDLGLRYARSRSAEYLREDDVSVTGDGFLRFDPVSGRAGLWILHAGVSIPLSRGAVSPEAGGS
jgi:hypothetical protein